MYLGAELGSGPESTLASRDHWGCVSIQDSFKYVSPWYEITALHWRSLDDWLEGRCDPVAMPDCFTGHDPYGEKAQRGRNEEEHGRADLRVCLLDAQKGGLVGKVGPVGSH